jgi:hypothetical protein
MQNYHSYFVTRDGKVFNKFGKQMKSSSNGRGYQVVGLTWGGKRHTKGIHRLVAEVYIPNPMCLSDVNHIDTVRTHNHVSNLEWMTHGENIKYSFTTNCRSARGDSNANAKVTNTQVHEICELLQLGYSVCNIRDLGYPYGIVYSIKVRRHWCFISDSYSF